MARVIFLLNSLKARVISLLTVYYNGEVDFRNEPFRNKNFNLLL
jgi:hypothetical protein